MNVMNDIMQGKWAELKDQVRVQWVNLTEEDMTQLTGEPEQLSAVLQQRYGFGKEQAELEINNWLTTRTA